MVRTAFSFKKALFRSIATVSLILGALPVFLGSPVHTGRPHGADRSGVEVLMQGGVRA